MDMNDFWQENKRFVMTVAGGLVVFLIGLNVVDRVYGSEARSKTKAVNTARSKLREPMYSSADRDLARRQNEDLLAAVEDLRERVAFVPREAFDTTKRTGSISNFYFNLVSETRESLLTLCSRNNLRIPDHLGLPNEVVRDQEIRRYSEGLDIVDRVVREAVRAGVERIDRIDIRLDPMVTDRRRAEGGRRNLEPKTFEENQISFTISGDSGPLLELLSRIEEPDELGRVLILQDLEMKAVSQKTNEAKLDFTLLAVHLHGLDDEGEEEL